MDKQAIIAKIKRRIKKQSAVFGPEFYNNDYAADFSGVLWEELLDRVLEMDEIINPGKYVPFNAIVLLELLTHMHNNPATHLLEKYGRIKTSIEKSMFDNREELLKGFDKTVEGILKKLDRKFMD